MFTPDNVAYWATVGSAVLFLISAGFMASASRWTEAMLFTGLFMANTSIAMLATST